MANYTFIQLKTMSNQERIIVLTLVKIFNWDDSHCSNHFQVHFYSLKTSSLLLSKQIKGIITPSQILFNYSLRVAYHPDQTEIIVKLSHFTPIKNQMIPIVDFTLNLDHLADKKVQFFPFGKNDKVLKISVGEKEKIQAPRKSIITSKRNQLFIRQKEEFLRKIANTSSSSRLNEKSRSKKSFSEQAKDLLQEVRSMRQHRADPQGDIQEEFNDYYQRPETNILNIPKNTQNNFNKSNSQRNFLWKDDNKRGGFRPQPKDRDTSRKSNKSQKHKLVLKNLQILACENQYYEQSQYPKGERKSDLLTYNTVIPPKKRLFKSQLY